MKVYVIDNGSQWTHREWRVLRYLKVDTEVVPNTTPYREIAGADGLILSGGAPNVSAEKSAMGNNGEYLDKFNGPILGVCAGMQFMCEHFGGKLGPGTVPEFGAVDLKVTNHSDIFKDLPDRMTVWASHNDEVKALPKGFEAIACSESCPYEAVHCLDRPLFGVQFHPEVENSEYGTEVFQNFLNVVKKYMLR
ncbi:MAG: GMP synthase subunit A [Thermoplasmata archaeon]|nr:GMP synthase subunit A [Thermoplasmata archaeon]